jgi:hypothetical protein
MASKRYTVLGWLVWQIATRVAKWKMSQNKRVKFGAAATVLVVTVAGLAAAKARGDD